MKKILSASCMLLIALVVLQACKKEDLEKSFTLNGGTLHFHTNAHPHDGNDLILVDTTVQSQLSSALSSYGVSKDNVKSVKLKSAVLRIAENSVNEGITFDPFLFASAHIKAGTLDQQQLAFKTEIPHTGLTEIAFESQTGELVEYLKQDQIELRVQAYNDTDVLATDYILDISYDVVYEAEK